ncbi:MAG TPA: lactate 2-monooxygenase [Candidatus Elarobacter sp.]|jgi:isopentenyl diphosphate isomerase/L-lactate dehydrogenase-like FMN-dependent dehydrogenase
MAIGNLSDVQNDIYLRGLAGARPPFPMTFAGLEEHARAVMTPEAFAYVAGGAGDEHTMRANREAFSRYRIVPRMLREVTARDVAVEVLGKPMPLPILTAPIGVLTLAHPDGEVAVARAAARIGVTSIVSTASANPMEQVAAAAPDASRWYQLYWPRDPEIARSFVTRAERAGYGAIVVTLDTWTLGWRPRDLELAHLPFLKGVGVAQYFTDPVFRAKLKAPPEDSPDAAREAIMLWAGLFGNPALRWSDLKTLREWTSLPIVVKGICHADDARAAIDAGASGVIVSNHGGRQVDRAIAALDALPDVAEAVGERATVLFDSGIRCGADILIALALGADAVLIGRPYVYGLALGGEDGVELVLRTLLGDLDASLALAGFSSARALGRDALASA